MKNIFSTALYIAAAVLLAGCAKNVIPGPNDANKRYLEAWMQLNHPDKQPQGLGIYVLDGKDGDGVEVNDNGFVLVDYRITDLEGNISSYTDAEAAKQLGDYSETNYYGPKFWTTYKTTIQAGLGNALYGLKTGSYRKVLVPSWLMTAKQFDSEQGYLDYEDEESTTTYSNTIYEFTVVDFTEDIQKWQIDSIGRFFSNESVKIDGKPAKEAFGGMTAADSVSTGFYYRQLTAPADTAAFSSDTTIYINYTGKLLNGQVFDTSIERVAKDNGLYSASRTYGPVQINWAEEWDKITMGSGKSDIIGGFALTLWQMRAMEKGVGVFYSNYGYTYSGSGSTIPGYAPLIFEIEIVAKPEE